MTKLIAYNPSTKRSGCILMQRMLGGTVTAEDIAGLTWEANSMDGMMLLPFNHEIKAQLEHIDAQGLSEDELAVCANCKLQSWRHDELGRCSDDE